MTATARKYNPGFLSDDELVASFCVRTREFESVVEALREGTGNSNTHQIVIGPRGSGKTCLLLRVAAEIRRDESLSVRFFPIVFAEESYEVSTTGEFWLECLSRLTGQAPSAKDGPDLHRTFEELRQVRDDRTLGDRCLGALQDFADREHKRLVLFVENLNMLLEDTGDDDTGWWLRQTLQTEPRILLLASATSRFDEMDDPGRAFYDLFRVQQLRPLDAEDCATLWQAVSGRRRAPETIQALRILTGGSPRLLTIVARFGADLSFRELMADLLDLVDDHTGYLKSHLDALPAQERKVYLALAHHWRPVTAREVSDRARLDTSTCSAQLNRLTARGIVEVAGGTERRKLYYVAERLYNIYYLMRRAHGPAPLIEALIRFMEGYYSAGELKEFGFRLAREASNLEGETLRLCQTAFETLLRLPLLEAHREELHSLAQAAFAGRPGESPVAPALSWDIVGLLKNVRALFADGRMEDAIHACDEVVRHSRAIDPGRYSIAIATALFSKGTALAALKRPNEAFAIWDDVVSGFEESDARPVCCVVAMAMYWKCAGLRKLGRLEEAVSATSRLIGRFGKSETPEILNHVAMALENKAAALLALKRWEEARSVSNDVINRFGKSPASETQDTVARAYMLRARAYLHEDHVEACMRDVETALTVLHTVKVPRKEVIDALTAMAVELGLERMRDLIRASPVSDLMLPLTTALEKDLGLEPRVAKEVEEIAEHIRHDLSELRKEMSENGGAPAQDRGGDSRRFRSPR